MRTTNTEYEQEHKQRTFNRNWKSETQDHETVPKLSRQCWGLLLCSVLKWSFPPASSLHVSHLTLWVWLWNMWCNHSQQKHEHERGGVSVFMNHSEEKLPCTQCNLITSWLKWTRMYVLTYFKTTASFLSSLFWVSTWKPMSHWTHTLYKQLFSLGWTSLHLQMLLELKKEEMGQWDIHSLFVVTWCFRVCKNLIRVILWALNGGLNFTPMRQSFAGWLQPN